MEKQYIKIYISFVMGKYDMQVAVRAGGFSALVVVGMAVIGVAILYSTFYVWLGVDSAGSMKVTDCKCFFVSLIYLHELIMLYYQNYEFISISCHHLLNSNSINHYQSEKVTRSQLENALEGICVLCKCIMSYFLTIYLCL